MGNSFTPPTPEQRLKKLDETLRAVDMRERVLKRRLKKIRASLETEEEPDKKALIRERLDMENRAHARIYRAGTQLTEIYRLLNEISVQGEYAHNTNRFLMSTHLDAGRVDAVRESIRMEVKKSGPDFLRVALERLDKAQDGIVSLLRGDPNPELGELEALYQEISFPSVPGKEMEVERVAEEPKKETD